MTPGATQRRPYDKLPPVRGFTRVPDEVCPDGSRRRMVRCDQCGEVVPSLGVGYHLSRRDHKR